MTSTSDSIGAPDRTDDPATQLRSEVETARTQLEQLESEYEAAVADPGVIDEDRNALRVLMEQARANYVSVQKALERQQSGTYGTCESCGEAISAERLEALPGADRCIACSE